MRPEYTLDDLLRNAVERAPGKVGIIDGDAEYTYAQLAQAADSLAGALVSGGVAKGDRVAIYMEKSWAAIVAMFGASAAGAAFVNISPVLKAPQAQYIVDDCDCRAMIGDAPKLEAMGEGLARLSLTLSGEFLAEAMAGGSDAASAGPKRQQVETDVSTILYTSGSTGLPKGVAFSQRNLVVGAQIVAQYLDNTADDRILSVLPFSFDYGLNQLTTSVLVGATLIVQHSRMPTDIVRGLRRHKATGLAGVPPMWALVLRNTKSLEEEPLEQLRYITNSGGRIPQSNFDELRRLLKHTKIYLMYGLTEAFRSTFVPPDQVDRGSDCIGLPIPNTEILVIKDGRQCAPGEVGELVHRGPTVALGYWCKEEATRAKYRPNPLAPPELFDVERVVYSGDLVRRDEDGYLYFVGRDDAMIKSQGYRMSPEEIENLLISSGLVREACVFGIPDPDIGHIVGAVVSLFDGEGAPARAEAELQLRSHMMLNAPSYMVPGRLTVLDDLPKNSNGKIDRPAIHRVYAVR